MKSIRTLALALVLVPALASAHENPAREYRQSLMTLLGMNVGPISAMMDGDIPWDAAAVGGYAKDLKAVSGLNAMRGFPAGSEGGHAKPEIWQNLEDFRAKMEHMQTEAGKLADVAAGGDRAAIEQQATLIFRACKACHEKYKNKDEE